MAEDPRLILHFKTFTKFKEKLDDGTINRNKHFCIIQDKNQFWVRDYFIDGKITDINKVFDSWSVTLNDDTSLVITLTGKQWNEESREWQTTSLPLSINKSDFISAEDRKKIDETLPNAINAEKERATKAEEEIVKNLTKEISDRIEAEAGLRESGDNTLLTKINEVAEKLRTFLEDKDLSDTAINKWLEIESFLQGITDDETLLGIIRDSINALDSEKSGNSTHVTVKVTETDGKISAVNVSESDIASATTLSNHINNKSNPHEVTKAQVGLGNVTNDALVTNVSYTNKKLTKTINGSTTDIVSASTIVADGGGVTDISGKVDKSKVTVPTTVPTLSWGNTSTIGSVDDKAFKITMPANPNTNTVTSGTIWGLTLNANTSNNITGDLSNVGNLIFQSKDINLRKEGYDILTITKNENGTRHYVNFNLHTTVNMYDGYIENLLSSSINTPYIHSSDVLNESVNKIKGLHFLGSSYNYISVVTDENSAPSIGFKTNLSTWDQDFDMSAKIYTAAICVNKEAIEMWGTRSVGLRSDEQISLIGQQLNFSCSVIHGECTWIGYQDFKGGAGNSSDIRYKTNITPFDNVLDKVNDINIFNYTWNKEGDPQIESFGVSAQLLEELGFNKIVHESKDGTKSVEYDHLGIIALKAIQELTNLVMKQLEEINELKSKLS